MSSLPDARYDALAERLRVARPRAGAGLRARVDFVVGTAAADRRPTAPRRRVWLSWRPALVLAPLAVAGLAIAIGLQGGPGGGDEAASVEAGGTVSGAGPTGSRAAVSGAATPTSAARADGGTVDAQRLPGGPAKSPDGAVPPSGRRLQDYRADLRVRVSSLDGLSAATTRAMGVARSLGGFVVSADYASPGDGDGDSRLVVRVPVNKVSVAVLRFAALGTVQAQQVSIQDLQGTFNVQSQRIDALRGTISELRRELRRTDLEVDARIALRTRLAAARAQLEAALAARRSTERRGRLATVSLTLTTREGAELQPPAGPGRFERTLRDALGVLGTMATWLLAALIVTGPFALLAALGVALERRRRRRAEQRLLEQAA